ncbi:unnamed protein product [Orchesella dallaii]|uniref:Uncharacterized protein n=1 Tax=Orchesella dallaii TaxID=48710 RepID=A0ABP1Q7B1_9HEXA
MSGRINTLLGARDDITHVPSSCGPPPRPPVVVELDSDSSDEDVEVSRYSSCVRFRNTVRFSSPTRTIDLTSLDGMDDDDGMETERRRRQARSPLPSTSTGGQTHSIRRTSSTFQTIINQEDEKDKKLENAETQIRKMEEETRKLKEEISSLKQLVAEKEAACTGKDAKVEQGRREICSLHQCLEKINDAFEEKNKEAEQLEQELIVHKTDIQNERKERVKLQEKLDDVIKQLQDEEEELNSIRAKFEEEKVIERSAKEEQRRLLAIKEEIVSELKTKLKIKEGCINDLRKLASKTKSEMQQKLSDIETRQQVFKLFFSKFQQKGKEFEKTLETKNSILKKMVEEKAEFERKLASYNAENERLKFKLKNLELLEQIKKKCMQLLTSTSNPEPELDATTGSSDQPESASTVTCNDPNNHPENSNFMDNTNDAVGTGTNAVLSNDNHEVTKNSSTALTSCPTSRTETATTSRRMIDAFTPKYKKAIKRGSKLHKVDYSARDGYRCICGKVLRSLMALVYHVEIYGKSLKTKLAIMRSRSLVANEQTYPSDQSIPNEDVRVGVKRKRSHLPDDDDDEIDNNDP